MGNCVRHKIKVVIYIIAMIISSCTGMIFRWFNWFTKHIASKSVLVIFLQLLDWLIDLYSNCSDRPENFFKNNPWFVHNLQFKYVLEKELHLLFCWLHQNNSRSKHKAYLNGSSGFHLQNHTCKPQFHLIDMDNIPV